jgi:hypothetical protein
MLWYVYFTAMKSTKRWHTEHKLPPKLHLMTKKKNASAGVLLNGCRVSVVQDEVIWRWIV